MDKYCRYDRIGLDEGAVEYSARLRTALVLVITQRVVAIFIDVSGQLSVPSTGVRLGKHSTIATHLGCNYVH